MVTLSITKTYLDGSILTEAMLDNIKNDVESWANGNIDSTNINFLGSVVFRTSGNDSLDFNDSTDTLSLVVDGTTVLSIVEAAASITIKTNVSNADMIFNVNDGGVDTTAITVTGSTANVTIAKNLTVSTNTTLSGTLSVTGESTLVDDIECLGAFNYKASAVGTDSYAVTYDTAPAAYEAGQMFLFKTDVANTGAATLNVNALGAKNIYKSDGTNLVALDNNDLLAAQLALVGYDGTQFQLLGGSASRKTARMQLFTGSGTWTKPSTTNIVSVVAAGGGGGGGGNGGGSTGGGGGGGAGYLTGYATVAGNITVTIGGGGTGGSGTADGTDGGDTTFGTIFTAGGGDKGLGISGGTGGAGGTNSTSGGTLVNDGAGIAGSGRVGDVGGAGGGHHNDLKAISGGGTFGAGGALSTNGSAASGFAAGGGGAGGGANGGAGAGGFCIVYWVE